MGRGQHVGWGAFPSYIVKNRATDAAVNFGIIANYVLL